MVLVVVIWWLVAVNFILQSFISFGLLVLLHLCVPLLHIVVAVSPACFLAILFAGVTYLFKRKGLVGNFAAHVSLYAAYIVLVYVFSFGCFELVQRGLLSKDSLTWVAIVSVAVVMPMVLRPTLEELGIDDERDRWFTLVCCFASLLVALIEPETNPQVEALGLTLSIGSFAGASSFLVKRLAFWNSHRKEEKSSKER